MFGNCFCCSALLVTTHAGLIRCENHSFQHSVASISCCTSTRLLRICSESMADCSPALQPFLIHPLSESREWTACKPSWLYLVRLLSQAMHANRRVCGRLTLCSVFCRRTRITTLRARVQFHVDRNPCTPETIEGLRQGLKSAVLGAR